MVLNGSKMSLSGCCYTYPSEKYDFVSWDDEIPIYEMENNMFQTTNQVFIKPS